MEGKVEASRHVEDRTTYVCIALPKGTHNPIYMVDLEEVIEVQTSDILKNWSVINVPLEQLNLDALRVIIVLVYPDEAGGDLVCYRRYSDRQTAEAVFDLVKHVKWQYHDHEGIRPA